MEILYPMASIDSDEESENGDSVTALVECRVALSEEAAFMKTLGRLLQSFGKFPGTLGSKVFRRREGDGVTISIIQRFAGASEHQNWLGSEEFAQWRDSVVPASPAHVRRYSGLESLFVSAQAPEAPPRWKMAVLLLLVVYPLSIAISTWGAAPLAHLPVYLGAFFTSVIMVWLMTYVLVPILTKCFQWWLTPARASS